MEIILIHYIQHLFLNIVEVRRFELRTLCVTGKRSNQTELTSLKWLRGLDLNQRPLGYEPNELTELLHPARNPCLWYMATSYLVSGNLRTSCITTMPILSPDWEIGNHLSTVSRLVRLCKFVRVTNSLTLDFPSPLRDWLYLPYLPRYLFSFI